MHSKISHSDYMITSLNRKSQLLSLGLHHTCPCFLLEPSIYNFSLQLKNAESNNKVRKIKELITNQRSV